MSSTNRVIAGVFAALVLIAVAVYLIWIRPGLNDDEIAQTAVEPTPAPAATPTPTLSERLSERLAGTTLKTSDAVVRELVSELSSHPKVVAWLANEDLIRRFVAAVDNIGNGISPTKQLGFLRPSGAFEVEQRGDELVIDPASFERYDLVTEVFVSLDTEGAAALYRELEPLIDDAYAEISPPGSRFSDRLDAAVDHLLEVTPPSGTPTIERKVVTYVYTDGSLEQLSAAQRQLLRMGPDNVLRIKAKLRDLKAAL